MKKSCAKLAALIVMSSLAVLLAAGCNQKRIDPKQVAWKPDKVAILPFSMVEPDPKSQQAFSPLTGSAFDAKRSEPGNTGLKVLDAALDNYLSDNTDFKLVNAAQSGLVYSRIRRDNMSEHPIKSIVKTGDMLKADAVIVGYLYRFAPRIGTRWAAETPASVALDVALVRTSDGAIIWKNSFDEHQVSLSEDIYNLGQYLKYGLAWFTAEQYAVVGLEETMQRFPWKKREETR